MPKTTTKARLSSTQLWVLEKMNKGIGLRWSELRGYCYFEDTLLRVPWPTIHRLENLKLIFRKDGFCHLTEFGKKIKEILED